MSPAQHSSQPDDTVPTVQGSDICVAGLQAKAAEWEFHLEGRPLQVNSELEDALGVELREVGVVEQGTVKILSLKPGSSCSDSNSGRITWRR